VCIVIGALCTGVAPTSAAAAWLTPACYPIDTVAPVVHTLTMSPTSVDVRTVGRLVTVTATATDASAPGKPVSGVRSIQITLFDYASTSPVASSQITRNLSLKSGTRTDGTWGVQVAIRPWVPGGAAGQLWTLTSVVAYDVAGNGAGWSRPRDSALSGSHDIAKTSWTPGITVFSTPDVTAPSMTRWTFSPTSVNTTAHAARVTVRAHLRDAQSGVGHVLAAFRNPRNTRYGTAAALHLVSGTAQNGTWQGTATVRRWVGNGTWHAATYAFDRKRNRLKVSYQLLGSKGWRRNLTVTSGTEATRPQVTTLTFPTTLDLRTTSRRMTASLVATDTGSGVRQVGVDFLPIDDVEIYIPMHRVSGTRFHGTWAGSVALDRCAIRSTTLRARGFVGDGAGNGRFFGDVRTLKVLAPDPALPVQMSVAAGSASAAGPFAVNFDGDVEGVRLDNVQIFDPATFDPVPMASVSCTDAAAAAVDCATGPVRHAALAPTSPLAAGSYLVAANENGIATQVTDVHGQPVSTVRGPTLLTVS